MVFATKLHLLAGTLLLHPFPQSPFPSPLPTGPLPPPLLGPHPTKLSRKPGGEWATRNPSLPKERVHLCPRREEGGGHGLQRLLGGSHQGKRGRQQGKAKKKKQQARGGSPASPEDSTSSTGALLRLLAWPAEREAGAATKAFSPVASGQEEGIRRPHWKLLETLASSSALGKAERLR